ncbi:LOW QUALITY PROTEIN: hypothetical protein QTO34_013368 [Cnephaeus nilssonii]|uniref:Coiled-coil domain containing 154 n=1 Tax=Cnephaeus nilssonii TaxID=3371016 RepID=A0AA40LT04_CNENI|nr:LOW QUALITY PROTEIN: hypothetical protein QTO34_013368 [Eptesicus nilssonii]
MAQVPLTVGPESHEVLVRKRRFQKSPRCPAYLGVVLEGAPSRNQHPLSAQKAKWQARRYLLAELADCNSSSRGFAPLSVKRYHPGGPGAPPGGRAGQPRAPESGGDLRELPGVHHFVPEQDTPKRWKQLEQWVADLQAEVVSLRGHKDYCERATLSLLQELRRAIVQLQDSELKKLKQELHHAAWGPEKEALEPPEPEQDAGPGQEVGGGPGGPDPDQEEAGTPGLERKGTKQEANLRLTKLARKLEQEEQNRDVACSALQRSQEEASQRVDQEVARLQAQVTKLGEEMSLRFLKREAKLCGFLQKSFLALEKVGAGSWWGSAVSPAPGSQQWTGLSQRMKASESTRLKVESSLREELESRWHNLQELAEERLRALRAQCKVGSSGWAQAGRLVGHRSQATSVLQQEECYLLEQCRGLDRAVVQLTRFVRQNQVSLNRVLLAEQKGRDTKGHLEESQAGELAAYFQENMEAMQLASEQAQQETQSTLELLQEKRQALEGSVAELVRQVGDLNDHFLALSWRLDLQEQTLTQKLCEAKSEWEGAERRSMEGLAWCRKEAQAYLREVRETVDSLPRQIEAVSDRCVLHKSDSDLKISAEGKAREFEVEAMRQELAALLSSVQLLREGNPGRKIAEIQGKLATNQIMKLENSIQDNKTIQNLKFNSQIKMSKEEMATLKECLAGPWSEEGPQALTLDSRKVLMSRVRQQFIKNVASGELVPVNHWGVYQAVRWLQWKAVLMNQVARWRPRTALERSLGRAAGACPPAPRLAPFPEINRPLLYLSEPGIPSRGSGGPGDALLLPKPSGAQPPPSSGPSHQEAQQPGIHSHSGSVPPQSARRRICACRLCPPHLPGAQQRSGSSRPHLGSKQCLFVHSAAPSSCLSKKAWLIWAAGPATCFGA